MRVCCVSATIPLRANSPGAAFEHICSFQRGQQEMRSVVKAFRVVVTKGGWGGSCGGKVGSVVLLCTISHLIENVGETRS